MNARQRMLVALVLLTVLVGCKQVQLGGAVESAEVRIDLLNQPGGNYQELRSTNGADALNTQGFTRWFALTDLQKSIYLGNFEVDNALIDPAQIYLVTVTGGRDTDRNRDGKLDLQTSEVLGTWHAIMPGASLLGSGGQVSALTEAAYQQVQGRIGYVTDDELLGMLDDFAAMVVADINGDGRADYVDLLIWSRTIFTPEYRGNIGFLDKLADAIRDNAAGYVIQAAAKGVLLDEDVEPVSPVAPVPTILSGKVVGDKVLSLAQSPYLLGNRLTVEGNLRVEPGVVIQGQGGSIDVFGDVEINGLPRQRVILDGLGLNVYTWGTGVTSTVRNTDLVGGRLDFKIQHLLIEDNRFQAVNLTVSNIVESANSLAVIRGNVIEASKVDFSNSFPTRKLFRLCFQNNYIVPLATRGTSLVSAWNGPISNLIVQDNTFNSNLQVLRVTTDAKLDISNNYWGGGGFPLDQIDTVIPGNTGPGGIPIIKYEPVLVSAHPDTPLHL